MVPTYEFPGPARLTRKRTHKDKTGAPGGEGAPGLGPWVLVLAPGLPTLGPVPPGPVAPHKKAAVAALRMLLGLMGEGLSPGFLASSSVPLSPTAREDSGISISTVPQLEPR